MKRKEVLTSTQRAGTWFQFMTPMGNVMSRSHYLMALSKTKDAIV
jgi:hypothetical protein